MHKRVQKKGGRAPKRCLSQPVQLSASLDDMGEVRALMARGKLSLRREQAEGLAGVMEEKALGGGVKQTPQVHKNG